MKLQEGKLRCQGQPQATFARVLSLEPHKGWGWARGPHKVWGESCGICWTSLVAQTVKHLSIMLETWVQSLGWEDSLEKEMATHSSTLALKISWTEELGAGYCPWGRKELARLSNFTFTLPDSAMV